MRTAGLAPILLAVVAVLKEERQKGEVHQEPSEHNLPMLEVVSLVLLTREIVTLSLEALRFRRKLRSLFCRGLGGRGKGGGSGCSKEA